MRGFGHSKGDKISTGSHGERERAGSQNSHAWIAWAVATQGSGLPGLCFGGLVLNLKLHLHNHGLAAEAATVALGTGT